MGGGSTRILSTGWYEQNAQLRAAVPGLRPPRKRPA